MSTTSDTYLPRDAHQPRGNRPWCDTCSTDRHLFIDSVTMMDPRRQTLAAAISCTHCGSSRVVATTAAFAAAVPKRGPGSGEPADRTAAHLHCGVPMAPADPYPGNAHTVFSTQPGPTENLAVTCGPGFCAAAAGSRWKYHATDRQPACPGRQASPTEPRTLP